MDNRKDEPLLTLEIDEKSFLKGQNFISPMTDLNGKRELEVVQRADQSSALALLDTLSSRQKKKVQSGVLVRSLTFVAAVKEALPDAAIVHDLYHLSADVNKTSDQEFRQEYKVIQAIGDGSLTGTKFDLLLNAMQFSTKRLTALTQPASPAV
jgi:transposase